MLRFTRVVVNNRWKVVILWVVLVMIGGIGSSKMVDRWDVTFSIPGKSAADANERAFLALNNGISGNNVLVFHQKSGDITENMAIKDTLDGFKKSDKTVRINSYFENQDDYFVSADRKTMYAFHYPGGIVSFANAAIIQKNWEDALHKNSPPGVKSYLTGYFPIISSQAKEQGSTIWRELIIAGAAALVILMLIFGTLPAMLIPMMTAICSIMATFAAIWVASFFTDISIIVQFLIGIVGLGIAIDYSLLMIFRFREELAHKDPVAALETSVLRSGRAIMISGTTVGISLLSMIFVPVPFIRSIAIGGMLIPIVSVFATLTIQVAVLSWLGPKINKARIPLLWRITKLDAEKEGHAWAAWSRAVLKRPLPIFLIGAVAIGLLVYPSFHMNPGDPLMKYEKGTGEAQEGRVLLEKSDVPPGVWYPMQIVVDGKFTDSDISKIVSAAQGVDGVHGASAPDSNGWTSKKLRVVEVMQEPDGFSEEALDVYDDLRAEMTSLKSELSEGARVTVAGGPPTSREFSESVYDSFPYAMLFVVILTFILLARALHSLVLPFKAVILNLLSLGAAYGVITFVFQDGHGSQAIWALDATHVIVTWIPLMIFAFLFGLSMDYEVFMLSRIREAYDETGSTSEAVHIGLARTGKLVTSAALILMMTFIVLSTTGGGDFKQFAIGLAAGIIIDATLIRALLVPTIIELLGDWNWKLPGWAKKVLFIKDGPVKGH